MKAKILIPIYMQTERPEFCCECNMCVARPAADIPFGSKDTHYCLLLQKPISRRLTHTTDPHHRQRCKPLEYKKAYVSNDGEYPLSLETILHYGIQQSKLAL